MILENMAKYQKYLILVLEELHLLGSFRVEENNINLELNTTTYDETKKQEVTLELPTKDALMAKFKEVALKTKKQEIENEINAICKHNLLKGCSSNALGSYHNYDATLEDQSNLIALVSANIDAPYRCAELNAKGEVGIKMYKPHTKEQLKQVFNDGLRYKQGILSFYGAEKLRLAEINDLTTLESFKISELVI
ncbi:hypothetical protein [Helicobacter cetorum]|uniref:Uncharacterized protein n=1 Tax=Helicobacter cetorum (strain ATCC BAA-540 / CCUG 52418 / MIT 99-5656) TaxID=1163745 RepID=I0EST5_HELCM|nr:hypothetical protein [Helicobacter cetorum]AFI05220.1 hypothetical protein HCD_00940 [Helicobacter cetorum MIT 99-5656]AFI06004.1 hypothetical protein HCD_05010 [Helicobacter cetorum MIT 99-5656]